MPLIFAYALNWAMNFFPVAGELLERLARVADVHALGRRACAEGGRVRRPAVGPDEHDVRADERRGGPSSSFTPLLQTMPPRYTDCAPDDGDLLADRLVARRLRVPGHEAEDFETASLGPRLERLGDAFPERLVVMNDEDRLYGLELLALGQPEGLALEQTHACRALVVVARRYPRVVPHSRRVVDLRLTGTVPRREVGQTHVRVRRAEHRNRAARSPVQDRDNELRAAGVERPEDAQKRLLRCVRSRVRRALGRVPRAGLRSRVVASLVADRVLPGLELVLLLEHELNRLLHRERAARDLRPGAAGR